MDLMTKNYLDRAENELILAAAIKRLSDDAKAKEYFDIEQRFTFYSSAISHSYYSIFYSAVDTGLLDVKLLEIYKRLVIRADELLGIFQEEKKKRGDSPTRPSRRQTRSRLKILLEMPGYFSQT